MYSQPISLSLKCLLNPYAILHEIGHALGLVHEHTRMDRDKFIEIDHNQLDNLGKYNFLIRNNSVYKNYSTSYDYASIMHYSPYDFGSFWKKLFRYPVMKSKLYEQYTWMMGQTEKMTFNDYKKINLCHCKINNNTTKCKNNGYPDFKNCSKCICPSGYTGDNCKKIISSDPKCGNTIFKANKTNVPLIYVGKINCYIFLKAKKNKKILLTVYYINAPPYKNGICVESNAFQIKYRRDKGTTGLLLCGHDSRVLKIISESRSILVFYKGIDGHSMLAFQFKEVN
uniref:Metalloendopeptidase n=1 Tax=Strongyloides stercoralis TaxID=6248 RepID=A0A0K0EP80_STRER